MKHIDLLTIAFLALAIFFALRYFDTLSSRDQLAAAYDDSLSLWQDEAGRWQAEKQVLQAAISQRQKWVDSLAQTLNIKTKSLETAITLALRETRQIKTKIVRETVYDTLPADTLKIKVPVEIGKFSYHDPWLTLSGEILGENLTLTYESRDSLGIAITRRRAGWNTILYQAKAVSYNPHSKITGLDSFKPYRDKRIHFSVFAGPALTLEGFTPLALGLGVAYRF